MTKKLLAMVVLIALAFPLGVQADGVLWHDEESYVLALWPHEESVYLFTNAAYYKLMEAGATEEHELSIAYGSGEVIQTLIPGDGALWALLQDADQKLSLAEVLFDEEGIASFGARVPFDWGEQTDVENIAISCPLLSNDVFAFVNEDDEGVGMVGMFDLATGEGRVLDVDRDGYLIDARAIFMYKDNSALIASVLRGPTSSIAFYTLNLSTGECAAAFSVPSTNPNSFGAPVYDAANDALYFVLDGKLLCAEDHDPGGVAVVGDAGTVQTAAETFAALLDRETVLIADWNTVWAYDLTAKEEPTERLSIVASGNELINNAHAIFQTEEPNVDVAIENMKLSPNDVISSILAQSTTYDIYMTPVNSQDYEALYRKGFLPPLSGSEKLTAFADTMYPSTQEAISKDGALVALPVGYEISGVVYNPAAFAAIGLTESDVPTNWLEFLQLLQRVPSLIADTEITAFDLWYTAESVSDELFWEILDAYELSLSHNQLASMKFDTDILRALLSEFEKIDFVALGAPTDTSQIPDVCDERNALFRLNASIPCESMSLDRISSKIKYRQGAIEIFQAMPLALAEGMEPMIEGEIDVAIINPYSENKNAALRYLETVAEAMPEVLRANLCPGWTEPIKQDGIEEKIAGYEARIAELTEEVRKATGDDKTRYQLMLDKAKENLAEAQNEFYWLVTEEDLAKYQAYAAYMHVRRYLGVDMKHNVEFSNQVDMYLAGAIDAKALLQTFDERMGMMLLED